MRKKREGVYAILLIFLIFVTSLGIDVNAYESKKDVSIDYRRIPSEEDRVESAEEFFRRDGSAAESSRGGSADEESAWREDGAADGSRGVPADENTTRHEDYASELAQSEFSDKKTAEGGADASDPAQGEPSTEEGIRSDICEEETEDDLTLYSADYEAEDENVIAVWQEENGIAYFINQDKYYQDEEATVPLSGLLEVGGFCYMFEADGSMVRSAFYAHAMETDPDGEKICYYDESGHMLFGQKKIDGFWYMFDKSTGAMRTGFVHIPSQNKICYYDENGKAGSGLGRMLYGQKKIKGYWYNFKQGTGAMQTGFVHIPSQNKTCYYQETGKAGSGLGRMIYGEHVIGGRTCVFKEGSGAMLHAVRKTDAGLLYEAPVPNGKVVCLDPGHTLNHPYGSEPVGPGSGTMKAKDSYGTTGVSTRMTEAELNMNMALKVRKELLSRGYAVILTREDNNKAIGNIERARVANKSKADAYIRIHANGGSGSARGAMTLCITSSNPWQRSHYEASSKLARTLVNTYCRVTGLKNNGVWYTDTMTGNNWSEVPTTIIEMGYMSNAAEDRWMADPANQSVMVKGIADGIDDFFA